MVMQYVLYKVLWKVYVLFIMFLNKQGYFNSFPSALNHLKLNQ